MAFPKWPLVWRSTLERVEKEREDARVELRRVEARIARAEERCLHWKQKAQDAEIRKALAVIKGGL